MSAPTQEPTAVAPAVQATHPFESMEDLRCPLTAVLGTGSVTVRQCLELQPESVLTLSQSAGEYLQLRANDVPIAYGEVVILEEATSIRITKIEPGDDAEN